MKTFIFKPLRLFATSMLNVSSAALDATKAFESLDDYARKIWRENEKVRLGLSDEELDKLIELDKKFSAIGSPGFYDHINLLVGGER